MLRFAVLLCVGVQVFGAVKAVRIVERSDVLNGKSLGPAGAYERIIARVEFTVDPGLPANQMVRDLEFAPVNDQGLVEFAADLYLLKPRDSQQGNGTVLLEICNRGGKGMLARFNGARSNLDPRTEEEFGDLLLMQQGYTVAWLGWQFDVPDQPNLLRLYTPIARQASGAITGLVRAEFVTDEKVTSMPLADRNHKPYVALESPDAKLMVRDTGGGVRREVPRNQWSWNTTRTGIEMPVGFEPGRLYDIVYQAADPPVIGLGLAGVRDFISFLKYGGRETLLADQRQYLKHALGFGISQSGRWLRTFLYFGFNADEKGRPVFDGIWADVAGGGRGSFNQRFGQASRDGNPFMNQQFSTDLFPFTDIPLTDAETKVTDGLLTRAVTAQVVPKIFYTNGSYEYWGRDAALIHITPDGKEDATLKATTRIYHVAGAQHGPGRFPPDKQKKQYYANPNNFQPLQRGLLTALHRWVKEGIEPPPSRFPRLAAGQLTPPSGVRFPKLAGVELPQHPMTAYRADYGPDYATKGIVTIEPPKLGNAFPVLVPQVDADGIDLGGVRMPEVSVPLGTYMGWNLRSPEIGAPGEMVTLTGGWMPFALTKKARQANNDPRPSVQERYSNRDQYVAKVQGAAAQLVKEGFLLEQDVPTLKQRAIQMWDWMQSQK